MTHAQYITKWIAEGKTEAEFYAWASQCGEKASNSYKDKLICQKIGIEAIDELQTYKPLDCSGMTDWNDINTYILKECENPAELAASLLELQSITAVDDSKNGFINANLSHFPKSSFLRFGDKNKLPDVSGAWFKSTGIPLDSQAESLSVSFAKEISTEDIIEFLYAYRIGKYQPPYKQLLSRYEERLEQLCGFEVKARYLKRLASIVRADIESSEELAEEVKVPF